MIESIPVYGRLILAPMDGISDPPFRLITRRLGSALSISEFINTLDFANQKHYQRNRLLFQPEERPFGVQLLDNDPVRMAEVAAKIEAELHPDFFDINLGCCTRSVTSRGAGAGMMRHPEVVAQVFQQVGRAVSVPLTAKLRLGWDEDSLNYRQVAETVVENGGKAVALHARTVKMAYTGKARWASIAELKARLPVPVIGNGDVLTTADARRLLAETGCDAAMIGRGAKLNPWIFSWRDRQDVTPGEVYALICYQYAEMVKVYPSGAIMAFRKFLKAYLEPYPIPRDVLRSLLTCIEENIFFDRINQVFSRLGVTNLTKPVHAVNQIITQN